MKIKDGADLFKHCMMMEIEDGFRQVERRKVEGTTKPSNPGLPGK